MASNFRCPSDQELADSINPDHDMSEDRRREIDDHVQACSVCLTRIEQLARGNGLMAPPTTPATAPMAETLPVTPPNVPRYEILGEVGRGAMGVVYKARDRQLDRIVALKVILAGEETENASLAARFIAEAQITAQMEHPSITPIYDLDLLPDGRPFFTMKLIEGESLAEFLAQTPDPTDRERCLEIAEGLAQSLAYVHSRGIVHRDLKPANVMLGSAAEVSIVDLGLGKVMNGMSSAAAEPATPPGQPIATLRLGVEVTQYGAVMGTFAFMPPEQALGEQERIGPQADVFAFGAIVCQMLTGQPPYTGSTFDEVRRRAATADLADARERLATCGADTELVQLVLRCLDADPAKRPADGAELASALAAQRRAKEPASPQHLSDARRLWKFGLVCLAAVAVFAAVFGWIANFVLAQRQQEPSTHDARVVHDRVKAIRQAAEAHRRAVARAAVPPRPSEPEA
ncbi:MAG: serine/threonine protein kinase [Planctomycetes bacterium]|nr:serine/threonine protein kinase [Planctomycetota bacterium]